MLQHLLHFHQILKFCLQFAATNSRTFLTMARSRSSARSSSSSLNSANRLSKKPASKTMATYFLPQKLAGDNAKKTPPGNEGKRTLAARSPPNAENPSPNDGQKKKTRVGEPGLPEKLLDVKKIRRSVRQAFRR